MSMIAHEAARYYIAQPNTYSVSDMRKQFDGKTEIEGGKAFVRFPDGSSLSVQKVAQAKFQPEKVKNGNQRS